MKCNYPKTLKSNRLAYITLIALFCLSQKSYAQSIHPPTSRVLIKNVEIFNGKDSTTFIGDILIENELIKSIKKNISEADMNVPTKVIDGKGKFVMPGLIDVHAHLMMESMTQPMLMVSNYAFMNLYAAKMAELQLMRGFTTVRDLGGGALSIKRAIDLGIYNGPRIFASGAFISQTGGHGDLGMPTDVPKKIGDMSYAEKNGITAIADGVDQVLLRSREQFREGASQLKLMVSGGAASDYDPLDVSQFTEEEIHAAVNTAENWGSYVTVHAYNDKSVQTAIKAGVKCIEHGQLISDETAKIMSQKNIWWSLQPFLDDDEKPRVIPGSENEKKLKQVLEGTDNAYKLAKKYKIKTAWGTDCMFDAKLASKQGKVLSKLTRWYTPFQILKMATADNAELLSLAGKRSTYLKGKLGVIEEGAYADIIIVDGNVIQNIHLIENPDSNFKLIMKGGIVYKNILTN